MSLTQFHREIHRCPRCTYEQEVVVWDRVDVTAEPDLKERLLRKQLQTFDCENCGETLSVSDGLLYIDQENSLLIYRHPLFREAEAELLVQKDGLDQLNELVGDLSQWQNLRLVSGDNELLEKIHLQDNGLDDRLMEILKVALKVRYEEEQNNIIEACFFLGTDGDILLLQTETAEKGWYMLEMPWELYQNAADTLGSNLPDLSGRWTMIDQRWAADFIRYMTE